MAAVTAVNLAFGQHSSPHSSTRLPADTVMTLRSPHDRDRCLVERFLCFACVALVIVITSLSLAFTKHRTARPAPRNEPPNSASEPFVFPTSFSARRPRGLDFYKDMVYETSNGSEIGYARLSPRGFLYRKFDMFNEAGEIAVVVTREVVQLTDKYTVEEKWPNATRLFVEFPWGRDCLAKEQYVIMDAHKNEIARSNRVMLELGTDIQLRNSRTNEMIGEVVRGAFELYSNWTAWYEQNSTEPTLPRYILATLATIATAREMEDADDLASD